MKHIKSINEFFDFLTSDSDEDKIASDFANRLDKAKNMAWHGDNPYPIDVAKGYNINGDVPEYFQNSSIYDWIYIVKFDDVDLASGRYMNRGGGSIYSLYIDGERINCKDRYAKKIFKVISDIHQGNKHKAKMDKLKKNINPAADIL
jgi:hypothetical protein